MSINKPESCTLIKIVNQFPHSCIPHGNTGVNICWAKLGKIITRTLSMIKKMDETKCNSKLDAITSCNLFSSYFLHNEKQNLQAAKVILYLEKSFGIFLKEFGTVPRKGSTKCCLTGNLCTITHKLAV